MKNENSKTVRRSLHRDIYVGGSDFKQYIKILGRPFKSVWAAYNSHGKRNRTRNIFILFFKLTETFEIAVVDD